MDFKNRKYRYLITGYDYGEPIKPFVVICTIADLDSYLNVSGDKVRYYEEL
jgi:hypothetical protein